MIDAVFDTSVLVAGHILARGKHTASSWTKLEFRRGSRLLELVFAANCRYTLVQRVNTITIHFPASLHRRIVALAEKEGYSVDQFLASAAAEKMAALTTLDYLRREAALGRREDFERFLTAVPHREPEATDRPM